MLAKKICRQENKIILQPGAQVLYSLRGSFLFLVNYSVVKGSQQISKGEILEVDLN